MPYLQVDLDGMDKWPLVATGCGVRADAIYKGFLDLWNLCWRQKSGFVGLIQLECLFDMPGRGERLVDVLCAFGFMEKREAGLWVSGSEKYLRISEARSKGGKSAQKNLKRGKTPGSSRKPAGKQPESSPGSGPALTSNIEHQSSSIEHQNIVGLSSDDGPPEGSGEYAALVESLFSSFRRIRKSEPKPRQKDWKALKTLRARVGAPADEMVRRWERGLVGEFKQRVDSFWDLDDRWDALASADPPKRAAGARDVTRGMVRAQDTDTKSFEIAGKASGF